MAVCFSSFFEQNVNVDTPALAGCVPRHVRAADSDLSIFDGVVKFRCGIVHICRYDADTNSLHWEYPRLTKLGKWLFRRFVNLCLQKNPIRSVR